MKKPRIAELEDRAITPEVIALLRLARAAKARRKAEEYALLAAVCSAHTDTPFDAEAFALKERDARRELHDAIDAFDWGD